MLILTRRGGESIIIGENIKVTLLSVRGGQASLGIEAPAEINVVREEIVGKYSQNGQKQDFKKGQSC